jgi:hypothetical protein
MKEVKSMKILKKLASTGLRESYVVEKRSGLPNHFKVPSVKIDWKTRGIR